MALFDSIYVVALAGWIGSRLFLSSGVIPLIFNHLDAAQADELLGTFVPRYCGSGAICGALALSSMVAVPLCYPEYRGDQGRSAGRGGHRLHLDHALCGELTDVGAGKGAA